MLEVSIKLLPAFMRETKCERFLLRFLQPDISKAAQYCPVR